MSTAITASSTKTSNNATGTQMKGKKSFELKAEDFIKMMITQLQNQDPTSPAKNEELLAQMSQIGQLQASTTLTDGIKGMVLQNQIGAAGNLIGKTVQGLTDQDKPATGIVNSVRVEDNNVVLELDNGNKLQLGRVTSIAGAKAAANGTIAAGDTTGSTSGSTTGTPASTPAAGAA
jgi:flagellar basal-body rod modification protein FlgD